MKLKGCFLIALLVVMLTVSCAFAETATEAKTEISTETKKIDVKGKFTVTAEIPESYDYVGEFVTEELYLGLLNPKKPEYPLGMITVAFDELADGRSIGEMSEDEIRGIISVDESTLGENVEFSERETTHGTRLLCYFVKDPEEMRFEIYTIYKGYQIGCMILPGEGQTLNEDNFKMATDFLSEVWIIE